MLTLVILSSLVWSTIAGQTEWHRIKDRSLFASGDPAYKYYNTRWHQLQMGEDIFALATGLTIGLDAYQSENILVGVADGILASAIKWIVADGIYNTKNNNNFFYQSNSSGSVLESLGTPLVKISFLAVAVLIRWVVTLL